MEKKFGKFVRKVIGRITLPPRFIKFGGLHKIEGTIKLQRICRAYSMPFEPIKVYRYGEKPLAKDIGGADRIIVRAPDTRWEYITKNASPERLKEIAANIEYRTSPQKKFKLIIQKVGLRENIESYGAIALHRKEGAYYEQKYRGGDVFLATQLQHSFEFRGNKLRPNSRKFIDEKTGSPNAHEMVEYLKNKVNGNVILRFVRYKKEKQCFFYDMTSST